MPVSMAAVWRAWLSEPTASSMSGAAARSFVEEHAGKLAVVVLAGVEQDFARHRAHGARHDRRLDVLGPVAHHGKTRPVQTWQGV